MPVAQSGGDGDDTSRESDTLICGFGPRRTRGDSNSVDSSDNIFSSDDMNEKAMHSSLICGFGGDGNSYGSGSSAGDIFAVLGNKMCHTTTATNCKEGGEFSFTSNENITCKNGERTTNDTGDLLRRGAKLSVGNHSVSNMNSNHVSAAYPTSIPVATKTTEDSVEDPRKLSVPRMDSSKSISSEGEMSMASEDAVVLMINMLEEVDGDKSEKDEADKRAAQDRVCGRVFKGQKTNDYESIPIELEIDNCALDQSYPDSDQPDMIDNTTTPEKEARWVIHEERTKSMTHRPTSTSQPLSSEATLTGIPQHNKQQSQRKTGSAVAKHVSINNSAKYIEENKGNIIVKGRNSCGKTAVSFQSLNNNYGFPSAVDQVQQRRRSSGVDQNLDVIKEDDNDSSTAATDLKSSFVSQATGSSKVSDASSSGDASHSSSRRRLNPIGEHAKSMARQLKMDGIVDASSCGAPLKRIRE